jgi:hypothetical protein
VTIAKRPSDRVRNTAHISYISDFWKCYFLREVGSLRISLKRLGKLAVGRNDFQKLWNAGRADSRQEQAGFEGNQQ